MYKREKFIRWMERKSYASNTCNTVSSQVGRVDSFVKGIDEFIEKNGIDGTLQWIDRVTEGPFETYPAQVRSAARRYVEFSVAEKSDPDQTSGELEDIVEEVIAPKALFSLEKEMQMAVRKQLGAIEAGLVAIDEGIEVQVNTGRIDILANDADSKLVVIELKVGRCPPGALEQVLGYAEDISRERKVPVRAFLVAGEFPDRIRAAANRASGVQLLTYQLALNFSPVV